MREDNLKKWTVKAVLRSQQAPPHKRSSVASGGHESWLVVAVVVVVLALATAGAYYRVATNGFVDYDDGDYVTENPQVADGLTWEGVKWAFTTTHAANWHPLTWLSHMLDVSFFGMRAGGHHLTNLAFHIASTLLLLGFLRYTTGRLWASALVASLFALHPLHVESVAWISERKDVLSTFFWFATLWMYACYSKKPGILRYTGVAVLFAMGLMSKPMLVTLPVVLLLLDYWPLDRFELVHEHRKLAWRGEKLQRIILEKVPLGVLACFSSLMTLNAQRGAMFPYDVMDIPSRLTNAVVSYGRYAWKMVWPQDLAVLYLHPNEPLYGPALGVLLLLAAATLVVLRLGGKARYLVAGWFWYLITLVPVLGIVQAGVQSHADRYTYVPLTGLFIMIAWSVAEWTDKRPFLKKHVAVAGMSIMLVLGVLTWRMTGFWKDSRALFGRAVSVTKDNYVMMNNLGMDLVDAGQLDEGLACLERSLAVSPGNPYTLNDIGVVMFKKHSYQDALRYYGLALESEPTFEQAHFHMGLALSKLARHDEAVECFRKAMELKPDWPEAYSYLGQALGNAGKLNEGEVALQKALSLNPGLSDAHFGLGGIYARKGDLAAAAAQYRLANEISEDYRALSNLGACLKAMGRHDDAEQVFRRTVEMQPRNADAHLNLAMILVALDRRDEAIAQAREAVQLDPENARIADYYNTLAGSEQ